MTDISYSADSWLIEDAARSARQTIGLLTEAEVAKMLQLTSVSTLATWRSQGNGPNYVKLGKRVFYTVNHISNWINTVSAAQDLARATPAADTSAVALVFAA